MSQQHTRAIALTLQIATRTLIVTSAVIVLASLIFTFSQPAQAAYGETKTYISKLYWGDGKPATQAFFDFPMDIAKTSDGEFVIADTGNQVIRKIKKDGTVSTIAGSGAWGDVEGKRTSAQFGSPSGVAERKGIVVVADTDNGKIKRVKGGIVKTIASGLKRPMGLVLYGDTVYFLDTGNNALKKVSVNGGRVTQITSGLNQPRKLTLTSDGKTAYVANTGSYQVKTVNLQNGSVSTLAGDGKAGNDNGKCDKASFTNIYGVHRSGNTLYVSDGNGTTDTVRKINLTNCTVSGFATDSGMITVNYPEGLTSKDGKLYVVSRGIGIVQRYDMNDADDDVLFAGANRFNVKDSNPVLVGQPKFLALSKNRDYIFFSENNRIRKIKRSNKSTTLVSGSVVDNYVKNKDNQPRSKGDARFSDVASFAVSADGKKLFVVDRNNNRIREVIIATGEARYLTGAGNINWGYNTANGDQDGGRCPDEYDTGVSGCAYFTRPIGSVLSKDGKYLYVADAGNNRIKRVTVTGSGKGAVKTIAGSGAAGYVDAVGKAAKFNAPYGLTRSADGKKLYVTDRNNHNIRVIDLASQRVSTLTGTGAAGYLDASLGSARFSYPLYITRDSKGNLYVSEAGTQAIRKIDLGTKKVVTLTGMEAKRGFRNGSQTQTRFNDPQGMVVVGDSQLLVADRLNDLIRAVSLR